MPQTSAFPERTHFLAPISRVALVLVEKFIPGCVRVPGLDHGHMGLAAAIERHGGSGVAGAKSNSSSRELRTKLKESPRDLACWAAQTHAPTLSLSSRATINSIHLKLCSPTFFEAPSRGPPRPGETRLSGTAFGNGERMGNAGPREIHESGGELLKARRA